MLMKKLLEHKNIMIIGFFVILLFTLLISLHFYHEFEDLNSVEKNPVVLPDDEELSFQNTSSFSDQEIIQIVNNKRALLRNLFYESKVYPLKEIDPTKTEEENEKFIVFDDSFIKQLNQLVDEDIFYELFNQMQLLKSEGNHTFYVADRDIFESIYLESAISEVDVHSFRVRVLFATDEQIKATVSMTLCVEEKCDQDVVFPFELTKINGDFKVSSFQLN